MRIDEASLMARLAPLRAEANALSEAPTDDGALLDVDGLRQPRPAVLTSEAPCRAGHQEAR
jgi:hypothetical protein